MPRLKSPRSGCPIGHTLDIVGDHWSMLLLRDLVLGKKRYSEFLSSPEAITTNVLANRLAKLEKHQLISLEAYQKRPTRFEYTLTQKGWDLLPVLQEICKWGNKHIEGSWPVPDSFMQLEPPCVPLKKPRSESPA